MVGSSNPVAGPYFDFSLPEATGVVAVLAPQDSSLLGLTSVIAPAIVSGNTVVAVTSYERPLPAVTLGEVMATSDLPGGVVNILTGSASEIGPWLASSPGRERDRPGRHRGSRRGARPGGRGGGEPQAGTPSRPRRTGPNRPGLSRLTQYLELKTVWHPIGV